MSQATITAGPYRNSDLFSGYYLEERIDDLDAWDCDAEAEAVFEELQTLWENEGDLVAGSNEDTLLGSWIDLVLDALGYDTLQETPLPDAGGYIDRVLYGDAADRREAMAMKQDGKLESALSRSSALLEAKQWDTDFAQRFSEQRSYRDASHQVKYYLEHTPESLQWGILTDGKKWRLYGTKDYATETYYEVDLPELLAQGDLDAFKYFYLFFRPEAFREIAGTSFLETVWSESETAAQELGEDLQDNVFTALRVLGEGFVESNELGDPDHEELKEQSLVLLYRLMFVFYAESRGLIHPDNPDAEDDYRENFSLEELRDDVVDQIDEGGTFEDFSEYSTQKWDRLQRLFGLIDTGEEALGIPPYNGGLFDNDDHAFLIEHDVADRYVAEVVYQLGTTENEQGEDVTADYADLDTRHLGTIYEGLLEHEFRIADEQYAAVADDGGQVWKPATEVSVADAVETVEEGELYVVNDDGERKATGAYYTPNYVVSYIVEETIDPLLDEIHEELEADGLDQSDEAYFGRFYGAVQDLTILDPAMGSGHFLTRATGYLTKQVMEVVREQERMGRDEQQLRRTISRECIYGVDINGMATELAKLSMWLETLAKDQPLAFLDHHLKAGNSLVGSDITEVLATSESTGTEQATLFDDFSRTRRQALEHVMGLLEELLDIENETVSDAKAMEELYEEIRSDDLYERLFSIANVHTAERFGLDLPDERDVYKELADAIDDDDAWAEIEGRDWYTTAQAMADDEQFFHWELEYPEVFFGENGDRGDDAGFDTVVGNPPYVPTEQIPDTLKNLLTTRYDTLYRKYDLSIAFLERAFEITKKSGYTGMITPVAWVTGENYTKFRRERIASGEAGLQQIVSLPFDVFPDAYVDTNIAIFKIGNRSPSEFAVREFEKRISIEDSDVLRYGHEYISYNHLESEPSSKIFFSVEHYKLLQSYEGSDFVEIGDITDSQQGIVASFFEYSDEKETDDYMQYFECDVYRYSLSVTEERYIDFSEKKSQREYYEKPRILLRRLVSRDDRLMAAYAEEPFVVKKDLNPFIKDGTDLSLRYLLACVNSSLLSYLYVSSSALAQKDDFRQTTLSEIRTLPVRNLDLVSPEGGRTPDALKNWTESADSEILEEIRRMEEENGESVIHDFIVELTTSIEATVEKRIELNTNLLDHLGSYDDGSTLANIGFTQPPENAADSILQQTTEQKPNLRVGDAEVIRESSSTIEIRLTARYKPDDENARETDQWGYTETQPLPALRITDLTNTEADLIEAFVPVAVDEAGGFAGFRETATKTNSLVDRLRGLTLPAVDDVADGLERYIETKQRADELDEKIQRTDDLIDEIVYELYGLTDEEIEIVEQSVQ